MNNSNNSIGEGQFELFSASAKKTVRPEPNPIRIKNLTVSAENVIVLSIVVLMVMVFFFSLGVERGKNLVLSGKIQVPQEAVSADELPANDGIVIIQPKEDIKPLETETVAVPQPEKPLKGSEQILQVAVPVEVAAGQSAVVEDGYTIQVASFKLGSSYADKEMSKLKSAGHETFILPKGNFSIVCVGKFKEKTEAQQFSKKLKSKYNDLLVRRL